LEQVAVIAADFHDVTSTVHPETAHHHFNVLSGVL
jgi:hypothetical protein